VIEKALKKLSDQTERRTFLGWAIKASAAIALSLLGVEKSSATGPPACCALLHTSNPNCSGAVCWCWTCCDNPGAGKTWACKECWTTHSPNDSICKVPCSNGAYPFACGISNCSVATCIGTNC
jgi:hypothetical protein